MMNDPMNHAVGLQLSQLLNQHFLRHVGDCPLKVGESENFPPKEMEENNKFPSPLQDLEGFLNTLRRGGGRMGYLTFG